MNEAGIQSFCETLFQPIKEQFENVSSKFKDELANLSSSIDEKLQEYFVNFHREIKEEFEIRDTKLQSLQKEIGSLKKQVDTSAAELISVKKELDHFKNGSKAAPQKFDKSNSKEVEDFKGKLIPFKTIKNSEKTTKDMVIVGDSIVKYLKLDLMNPGKENKLFCFPGANIQRIRNELVEIDSQYAIKNLGFACIHKLYSSRRSNHGIYKNGNFDKRHKKTNA